MTTSATSVGRRYHATGRVVFVVNSDRAFYTHRLAWATALMAAGASVYVIAPDTGYAERLRSHGLKFIRVDLGRETVGPRKGIRAAISIFLLLLKLRPRFIFLVQTAAYTLGWPAAIFLPSSRFVRVAGGVGRALGTAASRRTASGRVVQASLRTAARLRNVSTLFQTEQDLGTFLSLGLARRERSSVVPGTGLDVENWWNEPRDYSGRLSVMFASRLFAEKGVREFAKAARYLPRDQFKFVIVGEPDDGVSTSIPPAEIESWVDEGLVEWWGHRDDMNLVLADAHILVFPSSHPEGTPKILIEALSAGVPSLVSDLPGCRAVVNSGVTGWVLESVDARTIAASLLRISRARGELPRLSRNARARALEAFSVEAVLERIFEIIHLPKTGSQSNVNIAQRGLAEEGVDQ